MNNLILLYMPPIYTGICKCTIVYTYPLHTAGSGSS